MNSISQPLVSVLMPVYNSEKYLAEAIDSVVASTYQNWELIIVDDRSNDRSHEIAKTFQEKDKRIKVYVNKINLGDYPNRNQAVSYAKGKYLKFVDHDDYIYPYGLEQLVYYMEQFPEAGYGLCSLPQDKARIFPFQLNPKEAYTRHYFEQPLFHKAPLSAIMKKDCFERAGKFSGKPLLGDFEMWHIMSQKYPVVLMPQGIVWYRQHDEQESAKNRNDPMEPFKYILLSKKLLIDDRCPLNEKARTQALEKMEKIEARAILSAAKHYSFKKSYEMSKTSNMSLIKIIQKGLRR
ncbi:glycosyltransferase family 2 protein [Aegicerativicinus sediminis]|uniref:glycosyltransferase family 2 protein n=1 Tax=Aegicerativicinus sediminis TaxID=2893202 RepID=UPI001E30DBA4|nr:glycosyltransferase family 2 protein [Aegicerativicinus sediminis]